MTNTQRNELFSSNLQNAVAKQQGAKNAQQAALK